MKRLVVAVLGAALLAGCVGKPDVLPLGEVTGELTILAEDSLGVVFGELGDRLEAEHSGLQVEVVTAGSNQLGDRLTDGATGDLLATEDLTAMERAEGEGWVAGELIPFAANQLVIIARPGNPTEITNLAGLSQPGIDVALCVTSVPCGRATADQLQYARVTVEPTDEEPGVAGVLEKVRRGEADAGIVYRTDAIAAGSAVTAVEFEQEEKDISVFRIAKMTSASNQVAAYAFLDLLLSEEGQQILADAGYLEVP